MKIKPIYLILGGLAVGAIALMSFTRTTQTQLAKIFEKMRLKITSVRNIGIRGGNLEANIDLTLQNTTSQHVDLSSGGTIKGKAYRIYRNANFIAGGSLNNLSAINLSAGNQFTFKNISVEIPLIQLGQEALDLLGGFSSLKMFIQQDGVKRLVDKAKSIDFYKYINELVYEIDVEAFGQTFTFKQTVA